jgi:DNA-binding transcriptional MerR regulator
VFGIGEFAHHGQVSVRMLRHYDAIGLLRPARVEPGTGYRSYEARQLDRLNRIVALKDLGFTLDQVRTIVDERVSADELRGMLRLRRAELQERISADTRRLGEVEARLRSIEKEAAMPDDVQVKPIPAVRVARVSGTAGGFEPSSITPVIRPLYEQLGERLHAAGVTPVGPPVACYEDAPGGEGVLVHAGMPVDVEPGSVTGVEVVDLPPIAAAATITHHGSMDEVMTTIQSLARWINGSGRRSAGYNREVYLSCDGDPGTWVTELQEPLAPA